jgi:hypothetical protein
MQCINHITIPEKDKKKPLYKSELLMKFSNECQDKVNKILKNLYM